MNLLNVARFRANSDRVNLNCNRDPQNSKSLDEISALGITQVLGLITGTEMKSYSNIYKNIYSLENLESAFEKAKKGKSSKPYVIEFENNLDYELNKLRQELLLLSYQPRQLKRFIVRDPKTRTIHASNFRDRVVYHALVNIIEPIFEKIFISDSYASRVDKGTLKAVQRFDQFKRKVSKNGRPVKDAYDNNLVTGYVLKADIKHYFETVDHEVLLNIIKRKIDDDKIIWIIKKILDNFDTKIEGKGMPLGNLTSQFFANVYLNKLDYLVKHQLKAKYYIRYVDDFVILHNSKEQLEIWKNIIDDFLKKELKLELHPQKSKIIPLRDGIDFLGYKIFYHYKIVRKRNRNKFCKDFKERLEMYKDGFIEQNEIIRKMKGWFGYAIWADTYKLRESYLKEI